MITIIRCCLLNGILLSADYSRAQVLFDGALGLPATQGWTYFVTGGTQTLTNNHALLDTSAANSYQGGYSLLAPARLNHTNSFTLAFTAQLLFEAHANNNRSGFSVIVLSDDRHGIELAFWTNAIFAQSDSPLFMHAEETNYSTTSLVDYALTLRATNYVLQANGAPLLTGPIRNYEAFNGFPNPYRTPNFIFFGDDTTSASGALALKEVVLVTAPILSVNFNRQIAWTGVAGQTYSVLSSSNAVNWATVQTVTSATTNFIYSNNVSSSPQLFRVSYP
jgi:hypothetical protein